jgi:hypothetical protein
MEETSTENTKTTNYPTWWPRNLKNYLEKVKPPPWDDNTFISLPNEILEINLGLPEKITIGDTWVLMFLARKAAQDPECNCRLSIKEISAAMGPSTGNDNKPQARVIRRLRKFERCKLIGIERVHGQGRKNIIQVSSDLIEIALRADRRETKSILIGPEIFLLNLPLSTKTALGIKKALPRVKATTLAKKLRITFQQAQNHLNFIGQTDFSIHSKNPPKTLMKPPQNFNETPPKLEKGIDQGIDLGFSFNILGDIEGGFAPQAIENLPHMKESNYMQTVQADHRYPTPKVRPKDLYNKAYPKPPPTVRMTREIKDELEHEIFQHDFITRNKKPDALRKSAKVVQALSSPGGLSNILDKTEIDHIVHTMSGNKIKPLSPDQIMGIIQKQFTDTERVRLYELLSLNNSPAYGGRGRQSLSKMAYDNRANPGWSDIVWVWLRPPQFQGKPTIKCPPDLERPLAIVQEFMPQANRNVAINLLKEAKVHYDKDILPLEERLRASTGFIAFLRNFLKWGYNKATERWPLNPAWLKTNNGFFLEWEAEYREELQKDADIRAAGARKRADGERQDLMKRIIDDLDNYDEEHCRERYPAKMVDEAVRYMESMV